ncbi:choice-of-anchor D domain-containing protein [Prosthecobacter sp. SYSU 5D2]|uniref:choice-of-anchor D domain-containing protein n=1 Tax=Prosthecobacter sp. SYSU 5D2 TaxID=3134134 RepID=UPI0031FF14D2
MGIVITGVWTLQDGYLTPSASRVPDSAENSSLSAVAAGDSSRQSLPDPNAPGLTTAGGQPMNPYQEHLLKNAVLLDQRSELPTSAGGPRREIRLWRTGFKYPLIREEVWLQSSPGKDSAVRREFSVADHVLVKFPYGFPDAMIHEWAERHGFYVRHSLKTTPIKLVAVPDAGLDSTEVILSAFKADFPEAAEPQVALAEHDNLVFPSLAPDDISFNEQWALENTGQNGGAPDADIDAPAAWNITTGSREVLVAVIDTGVDRSHPDLEPNMWTNPGEIPGNGIDDDGNGFVDDVHGWDFFSGDNNPMDEDSHGTHCAGVIGAVGNNRAGISGVCWQVSMVGIRFLGPGGGSTSDAIESINYAASLGVDLTSNSWGGGGLSVFLQQAIEDSGDLNIPFIAAAGNDGTDNDFQPHFPAAFPSDNVISVASSTDSDTRSGFSNYGRISVDIAAPGTGIYSTVPGSFYTAMSGTSMAAPHVAGALALAKSIAPLITVAELKNQLMQTADPVAELASASVTGGRLNAARLVEAVAGPYPLLTVLAVKELPGGNGDGIQNPGETLAVEFRVTNRGTQTATDVVAMLSSSAGDLSRYDIVEGSVEVGTLLPGHATVENRSFVVTVDSETPTPHTEQMIVTVQHGDPPQVREQGFDLHSYTSSVVAGRVTDVEDGSGLANSTVVLEGPSVVSLNTDVDGGYTATLTDGVYQVTARAPGYLQSAPVEVQAPPGRRGVDFALARPQIRIEPGEVSVQTTRGQVVERELIMTNQGTAPLEWSLRARNVSAQNASFTLSSAIRPSANAPDIAASADVPVTVPAVTVPLNNLNGVTVGAVYTTLDRSVLLDDLRARGATIVTLAPPMTSASLAGIDAIIVDDTVEVLSSNDIQNMRTAIQNGTGLLVEADNITSMARVQSLLAGTGISAGAVIFRDLTLTDIVSHPITTGITLLRQIAVGATATLSGPALPLVREPNGDVHAAVSKLGRGVVVFVGNEVTETSNFAIGDGRRFANQIVDGLLEGPGWLAISPMSGTLNPGAQQPLSLSLDSGTLPSGSYEAALSVASNIPDEPALLLPVTFEVVDVPVFTVDVESIEFDNVILGAAVSQDVVISNAGTAELVVDAPTLAGTHAAWFSVDPPNALSIPPQGQAVIKVTFLPEAPVGAYTASLRLVTNDSLKPTVSIPIQGSHVAAPFITLNPATRTEVTLSQGQMASKKFTLKNTGKGILNYHPEIVFPDGRPSDWAEIEGPAGLSLAPGKSAKLTLHFHSRAHPASVYFARLRITSNDPVRSVLDRELSLTTLAAAMPVADPLSYEKTYVGESRTQTLTLVNAGQSEMVLRSVRGLNAAFKADFKGPVTVAPGAALDIPVTFAPRKSGDIQSSLVFASNKPGPAYRIPVSGIGARHPSIRATPAKFTVKTVPGVPQTRIIKLTNKGGEVLNWSLQPVAGNAGWLGQQPSAGSLDPKAKGQITLSFSTEQMPAGDYTTLVKIMTNDPERTLVTVPIALKVSSHAVLQAAPAELDLGEVWLDHSAQVRFDLTNIGNLPLDLTKVISSSKDMVFPFNAGLTLAPGQSYTLLGELASSKFKPFKGAVTVKSNSRVKPSLRLPVTATVSEPPTMSVDPALLAETLAPNQELEKVLNIANEGGAGLQWQAAVVAALPAGPADPEEEPVPDLSWLRLAATEGTASAGGSSPLAVTLDARGLPADIYEARIRITSNAPDAPSLHVPVTMTVPSAAILSATPAGIQHADTPANGTSSQTVTLRNDGNLALTLQNIASSDSVFRIATALVFPLVLAPGESTSFRVDFTPLEPRPYSAQLAITSDVAGHEETLLPVMGTGVPSPLLVLNPKAIVLTTRPGVPATQPITLENHGTAPLDWNITDNLTTGFLSDLSGTVAPGGSQVITLTTYSTSSTPPGGSVQSITLNSNDPVQPVIGIPFTRNILAEPVLLVTPSPVDFDTVLLPGFGQRQVTLRNAGNANLVISGIVSPSDKLVVAAVDFPLILPPGSTYALGLQYNPDTPEVLGGSLVFTTNNPVTPEVQVSVTGIAAYPPTLLVNPGAVDTTVEEGRNFSTTLTVGNEGGSLLNWSATITPPSARSWLSLGQSTGSTLVGGVSNVSVHFNASSLLVSSRSANITFTSNAVENGTVIIPVTLAVTPGEFSVTPAAIESATVKGAALPESAFSIIPRADASPSWTVSSSVSWITPSAGSGSGAADIILSYSATLPEGTHAGQVIVSSGGLNRVIQITRHVVKRQFSLMQTDRRHDRILGLVRGTAGKTSFLVSLHPDSLALQQVLLLPTDITSMDLTTDERTLYAISFAGRSISRVNLDDFTLVASKSIPLSQDTGNLYQLQAGREGRVYYTDATSNPALHIYDFETGTDVDTFRLSGLQGIGSFVVTPDANFIYARSQTGGGSNATSFLAQVECASDNLTQLSATSATLEQDPSPHPVLLGANLDNVITQRNFFTRVNLAGGVQGTLTQDKIYNASAYLDVFVTASQIIGADGGVVADLPVTTTVTAFAPDQSRLIYQDPSSDVQGSVDTSYLPEILVAPDIASGSVQNGTFNTLSWSGDPNVATYDLYFGSDSAVVESAVFGGGGAFLSSSSTTSSFLSPSQVPLGQTRYWRVDSKGLDGTVSKGPVWNFRMARAAASPDHLTGYAMPPGAAVQEKTLTITTASPDVSWTLSSDATWVTLGQSSGTGPATVTVRLNPALLPSGPHHAALTLTSGADAVTVTVRLDVMSPVNIVKMKADPVLPVVYALHRETVAPYLSWLLWVDPLTLNVQRAVMVGNAALDFVPHPADDRVYALVEDGRKIQTVERQGANALLSSYSLTTPHAAVHAGTAGRLVTLSGANVLQLRNSASGMAIGSSVQVLGRNSLTVASADGANLYAAVTQGSSTVGLVRYAVTGGGISFVTANYFSGTLESPLLLSGNGAHLIYGRQSFSAPGLTATNNLGQRIYAVSPDGSWVASSSTLFSAGSPAEAQFPLPTTTTQMAITADGGTLLLFAPASHSFVPVEMP